MSSQERLYQEAAETFGAALQRLVHAYEADPDKRRDLLQDIHLALWLRFEKYEARCSLRTWVYRVAHNIASSHVIRQHRRNARVLLSLEDVEAMPDSTDPLRNADDRMAVNRLLEYRSELERQQEVMKLPAWQLGVAFVIVAWLIHRVMFDTRTRLVDSLLPLVLFSAAGLLLLLAVRKIEARRVRDELEALDRFEQQNLQPGGGK